MLASIFTFNSKPIQVEIVDNIPWFNASQLCKALGYKNPTQALNNNIPAEYTRTIRGSKKGGRAPRYVSEPGIYQLLICSTRPEAAEFKSWLCEDVLPAIARGKPIESKMPVLCLDTVLDSLCVAVVKYRGNIPSASDRFKVLDKATIQHQDGDQICQVMAIAGAAIDVLMEDGTHEIVHESLLSNPVPHVVRERTRKPVPGLFRQKSKKPSKTISLERQSAIRA
jgi:hypothetical protein